MNNPKRKSCIREEFELRVLKCGEFMVDNRCTLRQCAAEFGISSSTVHRYMRLQLPAIDCDLAQEVAQLLDYNKAMRGYRGGAQTRETWRRRKMQREVAAAYASHFPEEVSHDHKGRHNISCQ